MAQRNAYILEHFEGGQPTVVGVFTSRHKAEAVIRTLPRDREYTLYRLPLNTVLTTGPSLADQQGIYEHWHYGDLDCETNVCDEYGSAIEVRHERVDLWRR